MEHQYPPTIMLQTDTVQQPLVVLVHENAIAQVRRLVAANQLL
jgi:hypothetical protein